MHVLVGILPNFSGAVLYTGDILSLPDRDPKPAGTTPDRFICFHADNAHPIHMANVFETMNSVDLKADFLETEKFARRGETLMKDPANAEIMSGLLAYMNSADDNPENNTSKGTQAQKLTKQMRYKIAQDNTFTVKALYRLGFSCPIIGTEYLSHLLENQKDMGFFDN